MELNLLVIVIFGVISCLLGLAQLMIAFQQHLWMLEARWELSRINRSVTSIHLGQHLTVNGSTSRSFTSDVLRRSSLYNGSATSRSDLTSFITCQSKGSY